MKFSRFRLAGFKSFVEPTEVPIEAGLTGVVGPNGCGKSNLVEALQWVMGENSYKAMRGSGMEDVIFSGSVARPARNAAEVSLVLDNSERTAPTAFNESDSIDVSRRIERDAGSSYRINGREVRARDVQLLFADASIGAHSAAIVGQGKVGSLISAKPEARRGILEEAAGIHGLFSRRHEAELRLKGAEQNLERLEDVLAEIERQLEGLRRQARQAVRYRTLSGEIRKAEAMALAVRLRFAAETLATAEAELAEATRAVTLRAEQHAKASRDQAAAGEITPALREQAASASAALQRIRLEGEKLDAEERAAREQIAELGRRLEQLAADLDRELALLADSTQTLARHGQEKAAIETESAGHDDRRADAAARLERAEKTLGESERLMGEANSALADLKARRGRAQKDVEEIAQREARLRAEQKRIADQRAGLSTDDASKRLEAATEALAAVETALGSAEAAALAAEEEAGAAREKVSAAQTNVADAEAAMARMELEAAALRSLLPASDVKSPLIESIEGRDGAEIALAAVLSDELDLSTDSSDPAHWRRIDGASDAHLPPGVMPLADLIDGPEVLTRRLAQIGMVDAADGARLQPLLQAGQILVSREGDLWRWDGLVATAASRRKAAERLTGRRRLAALAARIEEFRPVVAGAKDRLAEARKAAERAAQEEAARRDARREAQASLNRARDAVVVAEREQSGTASRLAALVEAEKRLTGDLEETVANRASAEAALGQMATPEALEAPMTALRDRMTADRNAVAEARMRVAEIDRERQARNDRLAAIGREEAAWIQRRAQAERRSPPIETRRSETNEQRAGLMDRPETIAAQRQALLDKANDAEATFSSASDALAEAETALAEADKAANEANQRLSAARELRGRLEERLTGAKERLGEVGDRIRETLQCEPNEAAEVAGLTEESTAGAGPDRDAARTLETGARAARRRQSAGRP